MNAKPYFHLFAHNVAVRGRTRSAIYDLQRQRIVPIPHVLHEVLLELRQQPWRQVQQRLTPTNPQLFEQYLDWLLTRDLGLFIDAPAELPALGLHWHSPHRVQNAVVRHAFAHYDLAAVLQQLDALHCRHLELHLTAPTDQPWSALHALAQQLHDTVFQSVTLLLRYAPALADEAALAALYADNPKLRLVLVHAAPASRPLTAHPDNVAFVAQDLDQVLPRPRYVVNLEYFTEAQQFNPYYNRKICVDELGHLKNCLLHARSFGHVGTTSLKAVLSRPDFQALWHAAPDRTLQLQDSELRYALFSADYLVQDAATGLFAPPAATHPAALPKAA